MFNESFYNVYKLKSCFSVCLVTFDLSSASLRRNRWREGYVDTCNRKCF